MTQFSQLLTASVEIPADTGNGADTAVMTFAMGSILPIPSTMHANWFDGLEAYILDLRAASALQGYGGDCLVKIYNPLLPKPNYPLFEDTFALPGGFGIGLPREVALCVSYLNTTENTIARARRRGRHYVPGFGESANDAGRPVTSTIEGIADAFGDYLTDPHPGYTPADTTAPCVYSRVEGAGFTITRAYVNNEWDTQRRRQEPPTSRYYPNGYGP